MAFAPICVSCEREMRCRKNGYFFADYGGVAVWSGDMFQCEDCNARVVVGVGRDPVAEDHEAHFARSAANSGFQLRLGTGQATTFVKAVMGEQR